MATITGTAGQDNLIGASGNDVIDGAGGIDTINAGAGDDLVRISHGTIGIGVPDFSLIDGGPGWDILDLSGIPSAGLYSSIGANLVDGTFWISQSDIVNGRYVFSGVAHASGFEEIHLGPEATIVDLYSFDSASGTLPGWKVVGGDENDFVEDSRGNDTIQTGAGSDIIEHYIGNDLVALGDGDDHYRVMSPSPVAEQVTIDGGAGLDLVEIQPDDARGGASFDLLHGVGQVGSLSFVLTGVEGVSIDLNDRQQDPGASVSFAGSAGSDHLEAFYGSGPVLLLGREGDDYLDGGNGRAPDQGVVTAYGGPGNDFVRGGDGSDWLNGGGHYAGDSVAASTSDDGFDEIWGQGGNDHIWGNSQFAAGGMIDGSDQIDAGPGADYVNGNAGDDNIWGGAGSDRLYGGSGNDWIYGDDARVPWLDGSGPVGAGNDHINGNKGDDVIYGGAGDDDLLGGQGNDAIYGDEGGDRLDGGLGDDYLNGGAGPDTMTGGEGRDRFWVDELPAGTFDGQPFMPDLVTDFRIGEDLVYVDPFIYEVLHPGSATDYVSAWNLAKSVLPPVAHSTSQVLEDAAAVQVGSDTYLFWDNYGNGPESGLRLANVNAAQLQWQDFYHFTV